MKINHVWISGYRNIRSSEFQVESPLILVGENNSGKSNVLKAMTLPLSPGGEGYPGRTITLGDLNDDDKLAYYDYIEDNISLLMSEDISAEDMESFIAHVPKVTVRLQFDVDDGSRFYFEKLLTTDDAGELVSQIEFCYQVDDPKQLLKHLKIIDTAVKAESGKLGDYRINLLPEKLFRTHLLVPGKNDPISFELAKNIKYFALVAERDGFSTNKSRVGASAIVDLLNRNIDDSDKMNIEKGYNEFFKEIQNSSKMDQVFNWARYSAGFSNADDFFGEISILPNMPPMNSLLNSIQLGYSQHPLSQQGLGYRNLVYLTAMVNALESDDETPFALLSVEEPEAHLSNENQKLLMSFLGATSKSATNFQLAYSTHNTNFIPKLELQNLVIMHKGKAVSLAEEMSNPDFRYLMRNPNLDIFKLLFSSNVILVEGISEELLIKAYLAAETNALNNIEVLSFHKGFNIIISLWEKVNADSSRKLAVVRDYDDQDNAKQTAESLQVAHKISINTTSGYTLEDDIVSENFVLLSKFFKESLNWPDSALKDPESLADYWKNTNGAKGSATVELSLSIGTDDLEGFTLPPHILDAINFFSEE